MYSRSLLITVSIFTFLIFSHNINSSPKKSRILKSEAKTVSDKKILEIEKIIVDFDVTDNSNLSKQILEKNILEKVESSFKLNSAYKPEKINISKIKIEVEKLVALKYPLSEKELKVKLTNEAEDIYKLVPQQTKVTVKYKKGGYFHTSTGVYYGLTPAKNGIKVGKLTIPLFDLSKEDKLRFIIEYRDLKIKKYVKGKVKEQKELKKLFTSKQITERMNSIIQKNESAGYIFAWRKWRTPEEVAKFILDYYSK